MSRFQRRQKKRASLAVEDFNARERQAEYERYHTETARRLFIAIVLSVRMNATFPLDGFRDWYMISNIPVELSRHTRMGRTMTRIVMEHLGYTPLAALSGATDACAPSDSMPPINQK
jgi:hypothetical protein